MGKDSTKIDLKGIRLGSSSVIIPLDKERDLFVEVRISAIPVMRYFE